MITSIEIKNINSIKECKLNFEKAKYKYKEDMIFNSNYLNPIGIYGANGSGKSSLLKVFSYLLILLNGDKDELAPFYPNMITLNKEVKNNSNKNLDTVFNKINSSIKINFKIDNEKYEYFIKTNMNRIVKETLKYKNSFIFNTDNFNEINNTFYPTLRELYNNSNNPHINIAYDFLSNIGWINSPKHKFYIKAMGKINTNDFLVDNSKEVYDILKKYKEFPLYTLNKVKSNTGETDYFLSFDTNNSNFNIPINLMSDGMFNNSFFLSTIINLPKNSVLIIDEIENALHPLTIMDFINIAKEKNIQLIFSSHNTFILQKLRPDQIFFANWSEGFSTYKKLSDIYPNIREVNNIEKMYLSSLFDEDIKSNE